MATLSFPLQLIASQLTPPFFLTAPMSKRVHAPSHSPSTSMDDEERTWRLDIVSISGFAIPHQPPISPQYNPSTEIPIYITIEETETQVSQTLESHPFPYCLQITIKPRSSTQSGIGVLIPLYMIMSIVISDHASMGQTLKFKLVSGWHNTMGIVRQVLMDGNPGRMYGVNEDDPFHLLGLLKFREFSVRNAGIAEKQVEVMNSWAECLKRNAFTEYQHHIQIVREGSDGVWKIVEDGCGMSHIKEDLVEKMEESLDGEFDGSLETSIVIPEDTVHGDEREKEEQSERMDGVQSSRTRHSKPDSFDKTSIICLPSSNRTDQTKRERISPPASDTPIPQSPVDDRNRSRAYSPEDRTRDRRLYSPEDDHRTFSDPTSPELDPNVPPSPPSPQTPFLLRRHLRDSSLQNSIQTPPTQPSNPRPIRLTGSNAIECKNRPNAQFSRPTPYPPLHRRSGQKHFFPPSRRRRTKPESHLRQFAQRYRAPFQIPFSISHNNNSMKRYDSYRPPRDRSLSSEEAERRDFGRGNEGGGTRKVPRIERRE